MAKKSLNYLPQLIIGLDSLNDDANYVHIDDVRDGIDYYCPCCKGVIKPRANKKDIDYQVQPHFYHESGGCNDETFTHYICKTWLFEKGCKFIVGGTEYEVADTEIEKTLHTSFGDYRPDIIVTTSIGKQFYFEVKTTNKKTEHYIPKWDELGNDVVEVDTRYFINQKYKNMVPEFELIYSNGECFIKSYSNKDYDETIYCRKREWKRQDKINYKIQWERLDWFWTILQEYLHKKKGKDDVLEVFDNLDYEDKIWCFNAIKNKTCIQLKDSFRDNINLHFYQMIDKFREEYPNINISLDHVSPLMYEIKCYVDFIYLDYVMFEVEYIRVRIGKGGILPITCKNEIKTALDTITTRITSTNNIISKIKEMTKLPFIKSITPRSHWAARRYSVHNLYFDVIFEEYIHNKYIKEEIGETSHFGSEINEDILKQEYEHYYSSAKNKLQKEFLSEMLSHDSRFSDIVESLKIKCSEQKQLKLSIRISSDCTTITLFNYDKYIISYKVHQNDAIGRFEDNLENKFTEKINHEISIYSKIRSIMEIVNSCKNKMWEMNEKEGEYILQLKDPVSCKPVCMRIICDYHDCDDIKSIVCKTMQELLEYSENYYKIRFLEER